MACVASQDQSGIATEIARLRETGAVSAALAARLDRMLACGELRPELLGAASSVRRHNPAIDGMRAGGGRPRPPSSLHASEQEPSVDVTGQRCPPGLRPDVRRQVVAALEACRENPARLAELAGLLRSDLFTTGTKTYATTGDDRRLLLLAPFVAGAKARAPSAGDVRIESQSAAGDHWLLRVQREGRSYQVDVELGADFIEYLREGGWRFDPLTASVVGDDGVAMPLPGLHDGDMPWSHFCAEPDALGIPSRVCFDVSAKDGALRWHADRYQMVGFEFLRAWSSCPKMDDLAPMAAEQFDTWPQATVGTGITITGPSEATLTDAYRALMAVCGARLAQQQPSSGREINIIVVPRGKHFTALPMFADFSEGQLAELRSLALTNINSKSTRYVFLSEEDLAGQTQSSSRHELYHLLQDELLTPDEKTRLHNIYLQHHTARGPYVRDHGVVEREFLTTFGEEFEGAEADGGPGWIKESAEEMYAFLCEVTGRRPAG